MESFHDHDKHNELNKKLGVAILLNFAITGVEALGGVLSGSLALLSDALHNFTDAFSLIISWIALRLSSKKHTISKTFGYKRAEILAALLNASLLIIISFFLFKEAVTRFLRPVPINSRTMIVVAAIGLAANVSCVLLLKEDADDNLNIRSAFLHLFADALSSLAVIAGGIFIHFFKIYWIDALLTILIGLYVVKEGFDLVVEATRILMQYTPSHIDLKKLQDEVEDIGRVKNIHHVHVWNVTEDDIHFEAHIDVDGEMTVNESCFLKNGIEDVLRKNYGVNHVTLQFESEACENVSLVKC